MTNQIVVLKSGNLMIEGSEAHRVYYAYDHAFIVSMAGQTINGVKIVKE